MTKHYSDLEIEDYVTAQSVEASRFDDLRLHLAACPSCRQQEALIRTVDRTIRSRRSYESADSVLSTRIPILALGRKLAAEESAARDALREVLLHPIRFSWEAVAEKIEYHTGGVVRLLCEVAEGIVEQNPAYAHRLADTARRIADELAADDYSPAVVAGLQGLAWKWCGIALRYLGDYQDALKSLETSEGHYRELHVSAFEIALIDYVRATIFFSNHRFDDSYLFALKAQPVFLQFGDRVRYLQARMAEGSALFMLREFTRALAIFQAVLASPHIGGNKTLRARATQSLGATKMELGDYEGARVDLERAAVEYPLLGLSTELPRVRWALGRLALKQQDASRAISAFAAARDDFIQVRMLMDASLVSIDLAEVFLALGESRSVVDLCSGLVERFAAEGMLTSAMMALAFVKEATEKGRITARHLQYVRDFLTRSMSDPKLLFVEPPD